jgi:hypothetical protein
MRFHGSDEVDRCHHGLDECYDIVDVIPGLMTCLKRREYAVPTPAAARWAKSASETWRFNSQALKATGVLGVRQRVGHHSGNLLELVM